MSIQRSHLASPGASTAFEHGRAALAVAESALALDPHGRRHHVGILAGQRRVHLGHADEGVVDARGSPRPRKRVRLRHRHGPVVVGAQRIDTALGRLAEHLHRVVAGFLDGVRYPLGKSQMASV